MSDPQSEGTNPSGNPHWRAPGPRLPVIPAPPPVTAADSNPNISESLIARDRALVAAQLPPLGPTIDVDLLPAAPSRPSPQSPGASTVVGSMFAAGWSPTAWRLRALGGR